MNAMHIVRIAAALAILSAPAFAQFAPDTNGITYPGNVGIGVGSNGTASIEVRPNQTISGSRVFSISNDENVDVFGAPGPVQLTWGSSVGAVWSPPGNSNSNVITMTMFGKKDVGDLVPLQIMGHLTQGTHGAIVGARVQAYIDAGAINPRGGTGFETLMRSEAGGDVWALNPGVACGTVACGVMHGAEFDFQSDANSTGKNGIAIVESGLGVVTGTNYVTNHPSDPRPISNAFLLVANGTKWEYVLNTAALQGAGGPISTTGSLWLSGGYTAGYGLEWPWMNFSSGNWALVPNGAFLSGKTVAGTSNVPMIRVGSHDEVELASGALSISSGGWVSTANFPSAPAGQALCYSVSTSGRNTIGYCSSDERNKTNVTDSVVGLDALMQIRPSHFEQDGRAMLGFVAQQVSPHIREAVWSPPSSDRYALDSMALLAVAVRSIQELKIEVDQLKRRAKE